MARLKRDDWLHAGLMTLAEHGVETLTIDGMCEQLNVTKGSFYHHFKSRDAYLEAILTYWEDQYTQEFINISEQGLTAVEKLGRLQDLVLSSYGSNEVNIRAWAQTDSMAREYQMRVDEKRLTYLYQVQKELHSNDEIAMGMAHLIYTTLIGSSQIIPALEQSDLEMMYRLLAKLSTSIQKDDTE
ncbi:MAG: TetR/AcrR family transcriptional regulator [Chloroflexota bacterium]